MVWATCTVNIENTPSQTSPQKGNNIKHIGLQNFVEIDIIPIFIKMFYKVLHIDKNYMIYLVTETKDKKREENYIRN